jgi:hypothetical protein
MGRPFIPDAAMGVFYIKLFKIIQTGSGQVKCRCRLIKQWLKSGLQLFIYLERKVVSGL